MPLMNRIKPSLNRVKLDVYFKETGGSKTICTAPYSGLYFTAEGLIKPCCAFSDAFAFGRYPQISIFEALNSKNRKKLQQYVKNNNLSFGCNNCLQNINNGNYKGSISSLYSKYASHGEIKIIDFELSYFCNLDCVMCYLHTNKKENSPIYDANFLKEIEPFLLRIEACRFYGGEPFLIPAYYKIWDFIKNNNPQCQVHIQTNGSIFNNEIKSLLQQLNAFLGISIDSMNPNLYENIRKGAIFNKLLTHINEFNEIASSQGKPITLSVCPMPLNWKEIPDILKFADTIQSRVFFNTVTYPPHFSFLYTPSTELLVIADFLKNHQSINHKNPYSYENNQKLQGLISSLVSLIATQKQIEQNIPTISLREFIEELRIRLQNDSVFQELLSLTKGFDDNMPLSKYFLFYINQLSKEEIVFTISNITKKNDIQYLKNMFQIQ